MASPELTPVDQSPTLDSAEDEKAAKVAAAKKRVS